MTSRGAADGTFDDNTCKDSTVFLDFGQVNNHGTDGYNGYGASLVSAGAPYVSDGTIVAATENYARAWYNHTSACPSLHVAISLNNFNQCPNGSPCTPAGAGAQWGNLVNAVSNWLSSNGYAWQIDVAAGDDMETSGHAQGWDCASPTLAFVDGFKNNNPAGAMFLDYGDAWGSSGCWSDGNIYDVAYGEVYDWPFPEIYNYDGAAADRWTDVSVEYQTSGTYGPFYFWGVMTECPQGDPLPATDGCTVGSPPNTHTENAPNRASNQLLGMANSKGVGQPTIPYSTNIKFQG